MSAVEYHGTQFASHWEARASMRPSGTQGELSISRIYGQLGRFLLRPNRSQTRCVPNVGASTVGAPRAQGDRAFLPTPGGQACGHHARAGRSLDLDHPGSSSTGAPRAASGVVAHVPSCSCSFNTYQRNIFVQFRHAPTHTAMAARDPD